MPDSYDSDYPVSIDLGHKVPDYSGPEVASPAGKKPTKTRMSYPSLYIDAGADLSKLQKDGWALIKYHRRSIKIGEGGSMGPLGPGDEKKETASAELEIQEICLPDTGGDMKEEFAKFAKKSGVNTEGMGGGDEEETPEPEEGEEEET